MSAAKQNWPRVKLGEVCESINGLWKGTKPPFKNVGIIRSTNFTKNCELSLEKTVFVDVEEKKFAKRKLLTDDLIVERSGGGPGQPVGRVVLFPKIDGDYTVSNFTSIIRIKNGVELDSRFLHRYLTAEYFQGATEDIQSNTTGLHNLDFEAYLNFEIPLPPLPIQREIVARLERELGAVDKLTKKFEELEQTAEAEFKATLKETFEEISHGGAETRRLGDVCEIKTGKKDVRQGNPSGRYPFFTCAKEPTFSDTYSFDCPALLVAGNGDVGYTQKIVGKFEAYQRTYVLSGFCHDVDIEYLYHLMVGCFQNYAYRLMMGNTMPYIKMGVLEGFEVPIPHLPTQREIVARLDAAKVRKEALVSAAKRGRETAALWRKAILKEAFE